MQPKGEKAHDSPSRKEAAGGGLTRCHTEKGPSRRVTQHAAKDSGVRIVPAIVANCPPVIVIENFSPASVRRANNPDRLQGFTWVEGHTWERRGWQPRAWRGCGLCLFVAGSAVFGEETPRLAGKTPHVAPPLPGKQPLCLWACGQEATGSGASVAGCGEKKKKS